MLNATDRRQMRMRIWGLLDEIAGEDEERTSEAKALSAAIAANVAPVVNLIVARHVKAALNEAADAITYDAVIARYPDVITDASHRTVGVAWLDEARHIVRNAANDSSP